MKEPLVSVIMPTYNYGEFLKSSIRSVLSQSYKNFELIIIDNFSTDSTEDVVKSFADNRIKYFKFANNGMVAASRNKGIRESSGEFIAFLDSDDLWCENKLTEVMDAFLKDSGIDLICHDLIWVFKEQNNRKKQVRYGPFVKYEDLLFKGNRISTSATAVKRSRFDESGLFSEEIKFAGAEDYEMWLRLSQKSSIYFLHKTLGEYAVHGSSLTSRIEKQAEVLLNVVDAHYDPNFKGKKGYDALYMRRKADILRQCARDLFRKHELIRSREYLLRSVKLNPFSLKAFYLFVKLRFAR